MEDSPFKNPRSRRLFEFLEDAHVKDDEVLRVPLDRCGWRSIVQIAEGTGSAPNTLYGKRPGQVSEDLQDLITRGLVEMRYFEGERGRGGEVMRFRISDPRSKPQRKQLLSLDQHITSQTPVAQELEVSNQEKKPVAQDHRHLATIMYTDMVGYTAIGQKDESLSIALIRETNKFLHPVLERHGGTVVKTMGDAFLVHFPDALSGVRCGYDIQRAVREFNVALSVEKQFSLRIGLHLGDVVESGGDIYGDAVNIASRIVPLAESGGVCLTRQVYDQVRNKIDVTFTSIGEKSLKNVELPIEVYKINLPWSETKSETMGSDHSRLAVLPFANMSPDPNDAYFADGITEEVISTISNISELTVISRTSIMKYKGGTATLAEIGRALKVGYIIEGSVRKSANRARIAAQLIDVNTDGHLWSRTYDREMNDVFAIQSEIAQQVAEALKISLVAGEKLEIEKQATANPEAHTMYLKGRYFWNERTRDAVGKALKYFEVAITLDPRYALAYSGLADCYTILADWFWMDPREAFPMARDYNLKALEIDPNLAEAHASLGVIHNSFEGNWQESENEFRRSIELKPGLGHAHMWYGLLLDVFGRYEEALEQIKLSSKSDPLSRIVATNLGGTFVLMGKPNEAIEQFKAALELDPVFAYALEGLGWAYYLDHRPEEALSEITKACALSKEGAMLKTSLACLLVLIGRRDEALKLVK